MAAGFGREQRQRADGTSGTAGRGVEHRGIARGHGFDGRGAEEAAVVFEDRSEVVFVLGHVQAHVELAFLFGEFERSNGKGSAGGAVAVRGRRFEQGEIGLVEGRPAGIAPGLQALHQQRKRHLLMLDAVESRAADLCEQS